MPMRLMFDRGITMRMGQCNVRRWVDDLLPRLTDRDVLGLRDLATHRLPLEEAPASYAMFQQKRDGCLKVVLGPAA
jgi:threonine dehydrogenase-like Zn-dependent dehydrogenase